MKNPHGLEPTRYMKKKNSERAIHCDPGNGPIFGYDPLFGYGYDIGICDNCNRNGGLTRYGNSYSSYECTNSLKQSLFVGTAGPDEKNEFSVLDYEVYTH